MTERLKEIEKRLKEIEKIQSTYYKERSFLEKEKDMIHVQVAKEIAISLSWKLEYRINQYGNDIILSCEVHKEREEANKELWENGGNYHHIFYLNRTLDEDDLNILHNDVNLIMDDGALYLTFDTIELYKRFLKEWNLKVDYSEFNSKLESIKKDIEALEILK